MISVTLFPRNDDNIDTHMLVIDVLYFYTYITVLVLVAYILMPSNWEKSVT